jgi:hypothetical protein
MEPQSPVASRVSPRGASPKAALQASSSPSQKTGSSKSKGPAAEEAMLGFFPFPDVGGASEEADAESARMPQKWKANIVL